MCVPLWNDTEGNDKKEIEQRSQFNLYRITFNLKKQYTLLR